MNNNLHKLSIDVGTIHFIGIGGIGMSGIAEILHNLGYKIQGSDLSQSHNVKRLQNMGINVMVGQKGENIGNSSVIVKSSAIKDDNPEILAARNNRIPIIQRAEMLAELMRLKTSIAVAGTHGKTTSTTMITTIFEAGKMDPTVINGGIINAYGTNARLGGSQWLIAEADESDGTFLKLPATIGIITNIDPEHMEHYGSYDNLKNAFWTFVHNLPFYGFAILCNDHPEVKALGEKISDRKIITYAINNEADIKAINIKKEGLRSTYDAQISSSVTGGERVIKGITLPMPGTHNVENSLSAIAIAIQLGFDEETIKNGFSNFQGVKRRFTKTGEVDCITIIDDYAHHPKEIAATLKTARDVAGTKKVIAVAQPHRYSRVNDLFDDFCSCFNDANHVLITDIYEAGESPIEGISKDSLVEGMRKSGHKNAYPLESKETLANEINKIAQNGDIVICMGAGTISQWANNLPEELEKLKQSVA